MINQDYLYTEEWKDLDSIKLAPHSIYIFALDPEDRSFACANALKKSNDETVFLELSSDKQDHVTVANHETTFSLNSIKSINDFFKTFNPSRIYIEVTGMSLRLAAPLMKSAIENGHEVMVVYSEPQEYLISEFKKYGINEDLSEDFDGVNPLPNFERILPYKKDPLFVALLGFEGGRLTYIIENKQPIIENIRPVIGVPGYRIDYPAETFWGNRNSLIGTRCWGKVEYAEANSITDCYLILKHISDKNRNPEMVVAPIGTKPHAIGAILYAIKNSQRVEIIYDNPTRSLNRAEGVGITHACNVTKLFNEN